MAHIESLDLFFFAKNMHVKETDGFKHLIASCPWIMMDILERVAPPSGVWAEPILVFFYHVSGLSVKQGMVASSASKQFPPCWVLRLRLAGFAVLPGAVPK